MSDLVKIHTMEKRGGMTIWLSVVDVTKNMDGILIVFK